VTQNSRKSHFPIARSLLLLEKDTRYGDIFSNEPLPTFYDVWFFINILGKNKKGNKEGI